MHDCTATFDSNTIVKFADDTAVIGLITNNDERAYLEEVRLLTQWCQENNLHLNVSKTKEMLVDFGRKQHYADFTRAGFGSYCIGAKLMVTPATRGSKPGLLQSCTVWALFFPEY
ncbi:hypothetical protein SKAU_G00039290 [Synaphobranchus kaupii]|uniref:Reverse transcriptase domain-containing protein n=1 Tax=Synaphobranchus kaupii TaxID=118154 RepID=A0A9Q1GH14_SYNKA|nr:hypothetical protein SKAU_G00039290 [Synaphobranchus kaupii]